MVFRVVGNGKMRGQGFAFERMGTNGAQFFAATLPWLTFPKSAQTRLETVAAMVIPTGRWRIYSTSAAKLCMGAPAFEAKAGDVIWLGSVDWTQAEIAPDMALDPARTFLQQRPALAETVQPAAWVNGTVGPCQRSFVYAMEFAGYPFEPGYVWGSQAQAGN